MRTTLAPGPGVANGRANLPTLLVQPDAELGPIETHKPTHLQVGDTPLGNKALYVARGDTQHLGHAVDVYER